MKENKRTGLGVIGVIQLNLIMFKLFNLITLSWWLVLSPILALLVLILICAVVLAVLEK